MRQTRPDQPLRQLRHLHARRLPKNQAILTCQRRSGRHRQRSTDGCRQHGPESGLTQGWFRRTAKVPKLRVGPRFQTPGVGRRWPADDRAARDADGPYRGEERPPNKRGQFEFRVARAALRVPSSTRNAQLETRNPSWSSWPRQERAVEPAASAAVRAAHRHSARAGAFRPVCHLRAAARL